MSVSFGDPEVPEGAPQAPIPGTVLVAMPVTVIAQGLFEGITDMMRRVEGQLDRAVLVGALALTEGDDGFPQLRGTWSGQAYRAARRRRRPPDRPRRAAGVTDDHRPEGRRMKGVQIRLRQAWLRKDPSSPRVHRRVLLAGAGVGGVLVGLLLLMTVFGKGDVGVARPASRARVTTTVPSAAVADKPAGADVASGRPEGRDPFVPVVVVPRQPQSAPVPSPVSPAPSTLPAVPAGSRPTPTPTPTQSGGAGYAALKLLATFDDGAGAEITVDGQSYRPATGETFSYGYRLESVDGHCVEVSAPAARVKMCLPA